MVNGKGGCSSSSQIRTNATSKFIPLLLRRLLNKPSNYYAFTIYTCLLFAFSISIIFFLSRQIDYDDDDPKGSFLPEVSAEEESSQMLDGELWDAPFSYGFHPCINPTPRYKAPQEWNRYITVRSNGGLNQMRTGICDMVAVARIMNATLVIPQLDKKSFWQDSSTFSDIFDEEHFIMTLQNDVKIVKELPKDLESAPRARKHFTSWSGMSYYEEMTRLWKEYRVIHVAKSDSRLANNDLPLDIQRLRCRSLYHALRFSPPIEKLGKVLSIHDGYTTEAGGAAQIKHGNIYCSSFTI